VLEITRTRPEESAQYAECLKLVLKFPTQYLTSGRALHVGDSLAVDGCCLTVAMQSETGDCAVFYLNHETESLTNLGSLKRGDEVHIEEALSLAKGLGGHLVSGHIDTRAKFLGLEVKTGGWDLWLGLSKEWSKHVFPKASIVVDGVSLTVNEVKDEPEGLKVRITLIPTTIEKTHFLRRSSKLWAPNIEFDLIGKMLLKQVEVYLENLNRIT
jgi:riboflavin synthase